MKVKKVWKYGTGDVIPEGAIFLSTQTETEEKSYRDENGNPLVYKNNRLVWHYFLVEVEE